MARTPPSAAVAFSTSDRRCCHRSFLCQFMAVGPATPNSLAMLLTLRRFPVAGSVVHHISNALTRSAAFSGVISKGLETFGMGSDIARTPVNVNLASVQKFPVFAGCEQVPPPRTPSIYRYELEYSNTPREIRYFQTGKKSQ